MDLNLCDICKLTQSKYVCPQCSAQYCSVNCFKAIQHLSCSEHFYEKCVKEELHSLQSDVRSKGNMIEVLRKMQKMSEDDLDSDDDDDDYDEEPDLTERLKNVNLDNSIQIWEKLNSKEQWEFKKLVANGDIIEILPEWKPWWDCSNDDKPVSDINENADKKHSYYSVCSDIPLLSQLTKIKPSEKVPFVIANILMSYACTARCFKGQHRDMALSAVANILTLSSTLRKNDVYEDLTEAYASFKNDFLRSRWKNKNSLYMDIILEDLLLIVKDAHINDENYKVKVCLSDIYFMLQKALEELKNIELSWQIRCFGRPPSSSEIKKLLKKIMYYLSWTDGLGWKLKDMFKSEM